MTIRYGARPTIDREVEATKVGAWSTSFTALYETDPGLVEQVLPPVLTPTGTNLVKVSVASVDLSKYGMPPFGAGTFGVECRHGDIVGYYPLLMPMTTEQSVIGGRETFGEPKKLAEIALTQDGSHLNGTVTRRGVTIIELDGDITGDEGEMEPFERTDFYLKFLRDPAGKGFDAPPSLVHCHRLEHNRSRKTVQGTITLRDSKFDPVVDLPVRNIVEMSLSERRSEQRGEIVATLDPDDVLPYVHQRYDDLAPTGEK